MYLTTQRLVAIAAALALPVGFGACGAINAVTGGPAPKGRELRLVIDPSASTAGQRQPGGLYEQAALAAIRTAAEQNARVWLTTIDGNAPADSTWLVAGKRFDVNLGGNQQLAAAARARLAQRELGPVVLRALRTARRPGSDVLGGLARVQQAGACADGARVVVLSDGGLNRGGIDVYRQPPRTPAERARVVRRLRHAGELPALSGCSVYLVGIGLGMPSRTVARSAVALWHDLIVASGARLASEDVSLQLRN
jgi:hypothetical protein